MKFVRFSMLLAAIMISAPVLNAQESVPKLINYQGRLTNASGQALSDGTYKLRFGVYSKRDASQNGDAFVWGADYGVTVIGGQFNVMLGATGGTPVSGAAINDLGYAFGEAERFIQLTVLTDSQGAALNTPQIILPRQQLLSTPYSFESKNGVPVGGVLLWWGDANALPPGFEICDGATPQTAGAVMTGNKPDLRDRFPKGATASNTNVKANVVTGGNHTINLQHAHPHTHNAGNLRALFGPHASPGFVSHISRGGSFTGTREWGTSTNASPPGANATTGTAVDGTTDQGDSASATALSTTTDIRPRFLEMFYIIRVK